MRTTRQCMLSWLSSSVVSCTVIVVVLMVCIVSLIRMSVRFADALFCTSTLHVYCIYSINIICI